MKSIEELKKRKTHTSSEVKARYNKKTYKSYNVNFRKIEDADIIDTIETEKAKGFTTSEAFKRLLRKDIIHDKE